MRHTVDVKATGAWEYQRENDIGLLLQLMRFSVKQVSQALRIICTHREKTSDGNLIKSHICLLTL